MPNPGAKEPICIVCGAHAWFDTIANKYIKFCSNYCRLNPPKCSVCGAGECIYHKKTKQYRPYCSESCRAKLN